MQREREGGGERRGRGRGRGERNEGSQTRWPGAAPPPLIPRPSTTQAWFVAGLFVLLALPVSLYEVALQLEHYTRPRLQLRVVRILFMVPVYALDSWLALRFRRLRLPLDAVRECYEAFVIYNFFMYLLAYLQDEYGDLDAYFGAKDDVPHLGALARVLPPWRMGAPFFRECQQGVLAYVVVRPLMTAAGVLAHVAGVPDSDQPVDGAAMMLAAPSVHRPHSALAVWAALANNVSQLWALYCLVLFYTATRHELAPIRPLSKFLVVKAVVFLSYWQGIAISLAVWLGVIKASDWAAYTAGDVAAGLQEFLICVEMFFAALAHAYAFPPSDYADPGGPPPAGLAWPDSPQRWSRLRRDALTFVRASPDSPQRNVCTAVWIQRRGPESGRRRTTARTPRSQTLGPRSAAETRRAWRP